MTLSQLAQEIDSLPPEAQKQVEDFIAFLKTRYKPMPKRRAKESKLEDEPFVGMWKDREDMRDSVKWVRELRQREWKRL
jgi:mRNA-degrading endonuclease RelE of RelBE toxin-antitoxin system